MMKDVRARSSLGIKLSLMLILRPASSIIVAAWRCGFTPSEFSTSLRYDVNSLLELG